MMPRPARRPALIFMWEQFAPYHIDRVEAVAAAFSDRYDVVGIEVASRSLTYAWQPTASGAAFERHVLFPGGIAEQVPWGTKLCRAMAVIQRYRPAGVFLCNQDHPEILSALLLLRLRGVRCYALLDAKFDDRARRVMPEALKQTVLRLFSGGIAGGERHIAYYRFLGLPERWVADGYSAVSVRRVRQEADVSMAPDGPPHAERDFVLVARFVEKKDIGTAIRAYALFRKARPDTCRRLILCGSGPQEAELRAMAGDGVVFAGFLEPAAVSRTVARGLALVLPSLAEPWGLVVNEAVALNIPVLCSDNVGARDTLVRTGVNGFVFEPGNAEGLAHLMQLVSDDPALWRRLALACARFAPLADAPEFARGVGRLIGVEPRVAA